MSHTLFLQSLSSSFLSIHTGGYEALQAAANAALAGTANVESMDLTIQSHQGTVYQQDDETGNPFDRWENNSIAIIPLTGVMLKKSYWWIYGVDDLAEVIRLAYKSDKIIGVLIKGDTPGGSTDSLYLLEDVLKNRTKPTFMMIDGMLCSCGYIAGSYCDKIYALNKMCQVGSIGVFARLAWWKNDKKSSYQVIEVYPNESEWKNKPEREAMEGKDELMKEDLSKLAQYYQETVKTNRPKIKTDADGVLTGKTFFAYEAKDLGMIDGIKNEEEIIAEIIEKVALTKNREKIYQSIN